MVVKRLKLSEVFQKDLKVVAYLVASWCVGLLAVYLNDDPKLIGLVPVINYIMFRLEKELSGSGYVRALKQ